MTLIMPTSASRKATVVSDAVPTGVVGKVVRQLLIVLRFVFLRKGKWAILMVTLH